MDRDVCSIVEDTFRRRLREAAAEANTIRARIETLKWAHEPPDRVPPRAPKAQHDARKARRRRNTGPKRDFLWQRKRAVGTTARLMQLASAAFRGVPYRALERRTREDLSPRLRRRLVTAVWKTLVTALPHEERAAWTTARIRGWMLNTPSVEVTA
jgi:hypothetical protein